MTLNHKMQVALIFLLSRENEGRPNGRMSFAWLKSPERPSPLGCVYLPVFDTTSPGRAAT